MLRRVWHTADRWGPGVLSIITLFTLIAVGWIYSERIARLEGKVSVLQHELDKQDDLSKDIVSLRNWAIAVYTGLESRGIKIQPVPLSDPSAREKEKDK